VWKCDAAPYHENANGKECVMAEADIPSPEASFNSDAKLLSNQYRLIRADGTEATFFGKTSLEEIRRLIGCEGLDTVTIDRAQTNGDVRR
jgi:hypothetical protein